MILVIAEQSDGKLNQASWETVAAAQELASCIGDKVRIGVFGVGLNAVVGQFASVEVDEILVVEHDSLESYTSDGFTDAVGQVVAEEKPEIVLFPHTYQTRDFAQKLATRFRQLLVTDCIGFKMMDESVSYVRPVFQGKFVTDVVVQGESPFFVSVQLGAFNVDRVKSSENQVTTRHIEVSIDSERIRQRPEKPFKEVKQAVDLSQAERIIAVGRGIERQEYLLTVQELAKAMGAEIAASRPICDAGWLPMDRQVGSSGQTVAPKLYLAIGISGAIQHLVGMKGARTIIAVNKDADAPIFEVADYGIVGDLFEVVPALINALGD